MLVLSRKINQTIRIGHDIEVVVVEIRGNVVRLGIQAPRSIRVLRSELLEEPKPEPVPVVVGAVIQSVSSTPYGSNVVTPPTIHP